MIATGIAMAVVGIAIFLVFSFIRRGRNQDVARMQAQENVRKLLDALAEFDIDYGTFPSEATASRVAVDTGTSLSLGSGSSNQLLRQLLVRLKEEAPFYGHHAGAKMPDELFADDVHALSKGECGFAFLAGLSKKSNPKCPVLVTPLLPHGTRFDPKRLGNKAVVGFVDGSVEVLWVEDSGEVKIDGRDLFDSSQPYWDGKAPDIRWQE